MKNSKPRAARTKTSTPAGQTAILQSTPSTHDYILDGFTVHTIRSTRRLRTISARLVNWRQIEVRAPALIPEKELKTIVQQVIQRIVHKQERQRRSANDDMLQKRAEDLNRNLFDGKLRWQAIGYVGNQKRRYGSCTPSQGTIRLSDRLKQVPDWVLDYVIVHELAHLLEPRHNTAFWQLVYRYAEAERARGYLMAMQFIETEGDTSETQ